MKKIYWMVNSRGTICTAPKEGKKAVPRKKFGNYFRSSEQAEIAKERMKELFKRVKKI